MKEFNTLSEEEIEIAKEPDSPQEVRDREFSKKMKNTRMRSGNIIFPFRHIFYYFRKYYFNFIFDKSEREMLAKFSKQTTNVAYNLRACQIFTYLWMYRPRVIVEFGMGTSTLLFAMISRKLGLNSKIISFEQDPKWYESAINFFPAGFSENVEIRLSRLNLEKILDRRILFFDHGDIPPKVDLVYIDSPTRPRGKQECDFPFSRKMGDIVKLVEGGTEIKHVFCDHRWVNHHFYEQFFAETEYVVGISRLWQSVTVKLRR